MDKIHESFSRLKTMTKEQREQYIKYYNDVLLKGLAGFKMEKPFKKAINDLYFNIEYLNNIGKSVVMLPIELMAEYRDVVTEERIDHWNKFGKKINAEYLEDFDIDRDFKVLNATSIGNIAYTILNSENKVLIEHSIRILNQIFIKHKGVLLNYINETV